MRVENLLEHSVARFPDNRAVTHGGDSITFGELWRAVTRLSTALREHDLEPGARIAILWENSIAYVTAFFAVLKAGHVVVPLDTSAHPDSLRNILSDAGVEVLVAQSRYQRHFPKILTGDSPVRVVISDREIKVHIGDRDTRRLSDILDNATEPAPDDTNPVMQTMSWDESPGDLAAIFYTSGSTGASKGVMLSHRNLVSNTIGTVEYLRLTEDDSVLVILPFYYIYGNSLMLTHAACGGRLVIDNRFLYPEVILDTMESEQVTGFSGVPSNFIILLGKSTFRQRNLESLRYFTQAGGAMAPDIIRQLIDSFGHKEIFIMYGQTEASPRATWLPPDTLQEKIGSIGIPVPGVGVEVCDEQGDAVPAGETGEIVISGPNVMLGYFNQPDETAEVVRDGRLHTGDLARRDRDGYLFIVGRRKEIMKVGGNRVSAKEVEECLLEHDDVLEAAVFGVPDDVLGEAVKAVVALGKDREVTVKALQDHCKRRLAFHKVPKFVEFRSELPKYQSGKVNKPLLAKQHAG